MDREGSWARVKTHRSRLSIQDVRGIAVFLFRGQEDWLESKLSIREDEIQAIEFLGYLGQEGSQRAVQILLKQIESREEALLVAVSQALVGCPAVYMQEPLTSLFLQQGDNAVKAGEILLSMGKEGQALLWRLWFLENKRDSLKVQILDLLAESGGERAEYLTFLAFLSEEENLVRSALRAAEKLDAKKLWGNVVCCLRYPSWHVRGRAIRLLGVWKEIRALEDLIAMGCDPDPWVEEERQKAISLMR